MMSSRSGTIRPFRSTTTQQYRNKHGICHHLKQQGHTFLCITFSLPTTQKCCVWRFANSWFFPLVILIKQSWCSSSVFSFFLMAFWVFILLSSIFEVDGVVTMKTEGCSKRDEWIKMNITFKFNCSSLQLGRIVILIL